MDQERAVQATLRGHVSGQVAIGRNSFHLGRENGEILRIALSPNQPTSGGQWL